MDDEHDDTTTGGRPRRYGAAIRVRLPDAAHPRIDRLARRTYRSELDTLRYLILLGLEIEEQRLAAADAAISVRSDP